jgi:hypothetical protein
MSTTLHYPENVPDAIEGGTDSLAAPGSAGVRDTNVAAWMSVGDFLARQYVGIVIQARARNEAARALARASAVEAGE